MGVERIDFLQRPEIAPAGIRYKKTGLVKRNTITARVVSLRSTDGVVLRLVYAGPVLRIVVGVVKQVEHLHL